MTSPRGTEVNDDPIGFGPLEGEESLMGYLWLCLKDCVKGCAAFFVHAFNNYLTPCFSGIGAALCGFPGFLDSLFTCCGSREKNTPVPS